MNEAAAREWLVKAWHHFSSARLLFNANHYTDVIAVELHYSIEIALKSFSAYRNKKILKTHDLFELFDYVETEIILNETESRYLSIATDYHISEAYPVSERILPEKQEIKSILEFTEDLISRISKELNIKVDFTD